MATENSNLPAPEEQVGNADDVLSTVPAAAEEPQPRVKRPRLAAEPVDAAAQAADPARTEASPVAEAETSVRTSDAAAVDFADEEAALAAQNDGLDLGEETPEEAEQAAAAGDTYAGRSGEELVALFARMLDREPVQSLRREAEALKIAFYKQRRAAVDAERRAFIENGGAEADFVPATDTAELRLKDLFREYRRRRDEYIANLDAEKEANLEVKLRIIEELKELVNSDETLNHTFTKFRELQSRWKETGDRKSVV